MTKNRTMRIAVLVLALALITSCFVGTTFAKYTSTGTKTAAAEVAYWNITTGADGATAKLDGADTVVFNPFATILDSNSTSAEEAADVVEGKLAPGTKGSSALVLNIDAEVAAEWSIGLASTGTTNDAAIKYAITNFPDAPATYSATLDAAVTEASTLLSGKYTTLGTAEVKTVYLHWIWEFDGDDTAAGEQAISADTDDVAIVATVTVTQVDGDANA